MDFDLDHEQKDLAAAVATLRARRAGPERARDVRAADGYDAALMEALVEAGFADVADVGAGPLEAVLITEQVAAAAGCVPFAERALVAPALLVEARPAVVVVLDETVRGPVRYAAHADVLLAPRGAGVVRIDPHEVEIVSVESPFGYAFATVGGAALAGTPIAGASAETLARWRRIALASEMVGCMQAALDLTVAYLAERRQFGVPLGSLQAVRHRLAELHVRIDGARWMTRQAAWEDAPVEQAALAATVAAETAERLVGETHQLTGAMGLTKEYDLHLWTMRLAALRQEGGGVAAHAAAAATARWGGSASMRTPDAAVTTADLTRAT